MPFFLKAAPRKSGRCARGISPPPYLLSPGVYGNCSIPARLESAPQSLWSSLCVRCRILSPSTLPQGFPAYFSSASTGSFRSPLPAPLPSPLGFLWQAGSALLASLPMFPIGTALRILLFQTFTTTVNVFSKMNTLSEDFVHYLSKDGILLKAKNLDFRNFSPHFHPYALPLETPTFSPFQGAYFDPRKPTHPPSRPPSFSPFRGVASQPTFPHIFSRILPISTPSRG